MTSAWSKRFAVVTLLSIAAIASLMSWTSDSGTVAQQANKLLRQGRLAAARRDHSEAESFARRAIGLNTNLSEAYLLAAECAVTRKDFEQALKDLSEVPAADRDHWLIARELSADLLHNEVHRLRDAERVYVELLDDDPDNVFANNGYARLLGTCGRRTEAIPHVLRLVRSGQNTDLLMLLSRETGALNDPELLKLAQAADPTDPNPLIGQAKAAALRQDHLQALKLLHQAKSMDGIPPGFHGELGAQLLANQRFDDLTLWTRGIPKTTVSAEAWLVLAQLSERAGDSEGTMRCYWEVLKLRPESQHAMNRMAQELQASGQADMSRLFFRRVEQLNTLKAAQRLALMSNDEPTVVQMLAMIRAYYDVGRIWEALAWATIANDMEPDNIETQQLYQEIQAALPRLRLEMTARDYNLAFQLDLSHIGVPLLSHDEEVSTESQQLTSANISFRADRSAIGFDFQYFEGSVETTHRMFEFAGGGIGIIDFDNDGCPDVFCSQGQPWTEPGKQDRNLHDQLYRNQRGQEFDNVSHFAALSEESGFGQGVAVGDVNNDGFPDLYVGQAQSNQLWLNNGDGTFTDQSSAWKNQQPKWTTSCLIADLNGDSFPDLYDVNYLSGDDVFDRICDGEGGDKAMCTPHDFDAALDQIWLNDGQGHFNATSDLLSPPPKGKGLGIIAMNTGDNHLSLFIANDTVANFFYTLDDPSESTMVDTAVTAGLAFNAAGKAEACMGVAFGDCTHDGLFDLFVTNFLYESNTLYAAVDGKLFQDETQRRGLHDVSLPVLGFGTQFLDANLDGRLELFVSNGYVQDLSKHGTPYRMQPQTFEWTGSSFQQLPASQLGTWSQTNSVGRSVALLDWNLDQKPDLVIGLLDDPSYILTNTAVAVGRGLSVRLIATTAARDAIGTTVTATIDGTTFVHQLTAGDGYQCSNERIIRIGCGSAHKIDQLKVSWLSGNSQKFVDVPTDQNIAIVEGRKLSRMRTNSPQ